MTTNLFHEWLVLFDQYIGQTPNRKAIPLIDNAKCHSTAGIVPPLLNLEVLFLPKNATSRLQPLDAGAIACIKKRFRLVQLRNAIDSMENGIDYKIYALDLHTAIMTINEI